ncbi:MAG TPA: serine hydrolase domain-containing protein [Candidatus Acidoferrum sp.]|jgi:CubicO group peptidase (beta-lactamase class C family)
MWFAKYFRVVFALGTYLLVLCVIPTDGQKTQEARNIVPQVQQYMGALVNANRFSGSILIARNGTVLLRAGYGKAGLEPPTANTPASRFRVNSIADQFSAVGILQLESVGKLNITDSICKYLSECPSAWQKVEIVHLLTHTSGIADEQGHAASPDTSTQGMTFIKDQILESEPGSKVKYSNSNYELVRVILDKVSGEKYPEYLRRHIFEPAQMNETDFEEGRGAIAQPLSLEGNKLVPENGSAPLTSHNTGTVYSTVEDLYLWDQILRTERLVPRKYIEEMFTPYRDGYGFAWKVLKEFSREAEEQSASAGGFSSSIRRYPDDNVCVIVLANLGNIDVTRISHDLAEIVFGKHSELPTGPMPQR